MIYCLRLTTPPSARLVLLSTPGAPALAKEDTISQVYTFYKVSST